MKFKSSIPPAKRTTSDHQKPDTSTPLRVEPITIVAPAPTKGKNTPKSAAKKKSMKKSGSKNVQAESSVQETKKNKGKEELKDMSDVSTHAEMRTTSGTGKGNPDETHISDAPDACKKLGLEDLNDAIDSTENMYLDAGNETNINDSVG
jgi:hypothetical protein